MSATDFDLWSTELGDDPGARVIVDRGRLMDEIPESNALAAIAVIVVAWVALIGFGCLIGTAIWYAGGGL